MADASVTAPNAAEGDQQSPGSDFNDAALMMGISAILEGRDLHSFCMKDMWGALEERLGISSAELQQRKSEILDLVQAEVQRIMDQENKPSSKNAKSIGKKRKNAENVDWRYMLERRERKMGKAAEKMDQASKPDSRPDIEQMPENPEESQQFNIRTPLNVTIEDNAMQLSPKTFPSGTHGFHALQKLTVTLDGKPRSLICQVSCAIVQDKSD